MSDNDIESQNDSKKNDKTVTFNYLKGTNFQSVHADGVIGGVTTRGLLHLSFFSERFPIPKTSKHIIQENDKLGEEVVEERNSLEGIVRQLEVDIYINKDAALNLRDWLDKRIHQLELAIAEDVKK